MLARSIRFVGVLLVLCGLAMFAPFVYENFIESNEKAKTQEIEANTLSEQWNIKAQSIPTSADSPSEAVIEELGEALPSTPPDASHGDSFAVVHIPSIGIKRVIAEGATEDVLSNRKTGVGHITGTQNVGEVGNFAIAGHRTSHGAAFLRTNELRQGDEIIVETSEGFYHYTFTSQEIVSPTNTDVLFPVPKMSSQDASERYITLVSCHPLYSTKERIISYGVLDHFVAR